MINSYERLIERLNHLAYMADPVINPVQFYACIMVIEASEELAYLPHSIAVSDEAVCFTWWEGRECFTVEVDDGAGFYLHRSDVDTLACADGSYSKNVDLRRVLSDWKSQRVGRLNGEAVEVSA